MKVARSINEWFQWVAKLEKYENSAVNTNNWMWKERFHHSRRELFELMCYTHLNRAIHLHDNGFPSSLADSLTSEETTIEWQKRLRFAFLWFHLLQLWNLFVGIFDIIRGGINKIDSYALDRQLVLLKKKKKLQAHPITVWLGFEPKLLTLCIISALTNI